MAMIYVNSTALPYPKRGLEQIVTTVVDSARSANGKVVGQKIGRDQYKLNNLEWPWLSAAEWSAILKLFNKFYVKVKFLDSVSNKWITLRMYPGDRSAEPYYIDPETGNTTYYQNCKVNIIDCGY